MATNQFVDSSTDQDWSNSFNWTQSAVPSIGDGYDVRISSTCVLSANSEMETGKTFVIDVGRTFTLGDYDLNCGTSDVTASGAISIGSGDWTVGAFTASSTFVGTNIGGSLQFSSTLTLTDCTYTNYLSGESIGPVFVWNGTVANVANVFGTNVGSSSLSTLYFMFGASASTSCTIQGGSSGDTLYSFFNLNNTGNSAEFILTGGREYRNDVSNLTIYSSNNANQTLTVNPGDGTTNTIISNYDGSSDNVIAIYNNNRIVMNGISTTAHTGFEIIGVGGTNSVGLIGYNASLGTSYFKAVHITGCTLELSRNNAVYPTAFDDNYVIEDVSIIDVPSTLAHVRINRSGVKAKLENITFGDSGNPAISFTDASVGTSVIYFNNSNLGSASSFGTFGSDAAIVVSKNHDDVVGDTYIWTNANINLDSDTLNVTGSALASGDNVYLQSAVQYIITSTTKIDYSDTLGTFYSTSGATLVLGDEDFDTGDVTSYGAVSMGAGTWTCQDFTLSSTMTGTGDGTIAFTGNANIENANWNNSGSSIFGPIMSWNGIVNKYLHCFGTNVGDSAAHGVTINNGSSANAKLTIGGGSETTGSIMNCLIYVNNGAGNNAELELIGGRTYTNSNTNRTIFRGGSCNFTVLKGDGINNTIIENTYPQSASFIYDIATAGNSTFNGDSVISSTGYIFRGRIGYLKNYAKTRSSGSTILKGIDMEYCYLNLGASGNSDFTGDTIEDITIQSISAGNSFLCNGNNCQFRIVNFTDNTNKTINISNTGTLSKATFIDSSFSTSNVSLAGTNWIVSRNHGDISGAYHLWSNDNLTLSSDTLDISSSALTSGDDVYLWSAKTYTLDSTTATDCSAILGSLYSPLGTITNTMGTDLTVSGSFNAGTLNAGPDKITVLGDFTAGTFTHQDGEIELSTTGTQTVGGSEMTFYDLTHGTGIVVYSENGNPLTVSNTFTPSTGTTRYSGTATTAPLTYYNLDLYGTILMSGFTCENLLLSGTVTEGSSVSTTNGNLTITGTVTGTGQTYLFSDGGSSQIIGKAQLIGDIQSTGGTDLTFATNDCNPKSITMASGTLTVDAGVTVRPQTGYTNGGALSVTDTGYLIDVASKRIHAYEGTIEANASDVVEGTYSLLITPNSATNYVQVTYNVNDTDNGFTVDRNQEYNFVFKAKFNQSLTPANQAAKMIISTGKTGTGTVLATEIISGTPNTWHTFEQSFNSGSNTELFVTWYARRKTALQSIVHRFDDSYLEKVL